ncbi:MAG: arylsulfatase [Verrucomicrobia bacterium]|nr:arylsulfatase [Verrucomicrobiota bacterium]
MKPRHPRIAALGLAALALATSGLLAAERARPRNIVIIYADDLGYGDVGCYGAKRVATPNVDRLAREGLRFTAAYATSGTCTPSRFALLSGEYPWRRDGTGVLPGDAALVIDLNRATLPTLLKKAGYTTGVVGKWHLGLGAKGQPIDWNKPITPGPREVGFDYHFIMAATGDRVPCVYVEQQRVVGLDPADPLRVDYQKPFPGELNGVTDRATLKMDWSHGHNMAVVNGVGRIGYYTGGKAAQWVDEDMADTFTKHAVDFIAREKAKPFFLFFATHSIHVPRVPHARFAGKTGMGPRGDAIVEFDWQVGEVLAALEKHGLTRDTLVLLSSDNGPVVDDGYKDQAVEKLGDHRPAGPFRGGKYSRFEAGTRVPFIVRWPGHVKPGTTTEAMVSQVDFAATFAAMAGVKPGDNDAPDSLDVGAALLGQSPRGRDYVIEHSGRLALREGNWKFIQPAPQGVAFNKATATETANSPQPQLYDLATDPGEKTNVAAANAERVTAMGDKLAALQKNPRTRP